jgi:hypothetical protein
MPRVGIEPTIPAFEQMKTVHALDRAATVIGRNYIAISNYSIALLFTFQTKNVTLPKPTNIEMK